VPNESRFRTYRSEIKTRQPIQPHLRPILSPRRIAAGPEPLRMLFETHGLRVERLTPLAELYSAPPPFT
jgi:hypothetical protein